MRPMPARDRLAMHPATTASSSHVLACKRAHRPLFHEDAAHVQISSLFNNMEIDIDKGS